MKTSASEQRHYIIVFRKGLELEGGMGDLLLFNHIAKICNM